MIIYRPFLWLEVRQDIETMFYNATDLIKAFNVWKTTIKTLYDFLSNQKTIEFMKQLTFENNVNTQESGELETSFKPVETRRGKFWGTWMHAKLLLDLMMRLSPEFKSKAYDFIIDWFTLAGKRNELKEWYKKMTQAISQTENTNFREEATMINVLCTGSCASNQRARLGIDKMKQMDELQLMNAWLIKAWLNIEERKNILIKSCG